MNWEFIPDRPIYTQILEQLEIEIVAGRYRPGERLPSVRELAEEASVNPNTMQRAMADLEQRGMATGYRTSGRFVTEDTEVIRQARDRLLREKLEDFSRSMEQLGVSPNEIKELLYQWVKENEKS